jgi:hypothetical protein
MVRRVLTALVVFALGAAGGYLAARGWEETSRLRRGAGGADAEHAEPPSSRPRARSRREARRPLHSRLRGDITLAAISAYEVGNWNVFFAAEAGGSATLAGLIFVAVSINVERILKYATLPSRAAQTLATLILVQLVATFTLVPARAPRERSPHE